MQGLPSEADVARAIGESTPRGEERRDHTARSVRDALAERLGVDPRELGSLGAETATRALANLNLKPERARPPDAAAPAHGSPGAHRPGRGASYPVARQRRFVRLPKKPMLMSRTSTHLDRS